MTMHKVSVSFLLLSAIWVLAACSPEHNPGTHGSFTGLSQSGDPLTGGPGTPAPLPNGVSEDQFASTFATTLQPVLRANCAACHGVNQVPKHSVESALEASRTIRNFALVNFQAPASSRLVVKIQGGHNGFPASLATQLQNAIQAWADALPDGTTIPTEPLPPSIPLAPTYKSIFANIIETKCIGCHSEYSTYRGLLGDVKPGNPTGSDLYDETSRGKMPRGGTRLSDAELQAIRTWILDGALNN